MGYGSVKEPQVGLGHLFQVSNEDEICKIPNSTTLIDTFQCPVARDPQRLQCYERHEMPSPPQVATSPQLQYQLTHDKLELIKISMLLLI